MILYCTNPNTKHADTYVQSVTTERLVFGKAYEVSKKLAKVLLAGEGWATDPPGTVALTVETGPGKISGIGEQRTKALVTLGITTMQQFVDADAKELDKALDGSSLSQILGWQNEAKKLTSEI